MFMVNDLVIAFIYALSYCAELIYNLMGRESQERGISLLNCSTGKEVKFCPKEKDIGEKE